MSGIYIDGISLGENHWAIISKFFRAVVGPTDTTVEGRFVEEHGKIWLILNGKRHEAIPVPDHGDLIDRNVVKNDWFVTDGGTIAVAVVDIDGCQTIIPADKEVDT